MSPFETAGLFVAMLALALLPSASVALVVARSSTSGFRNGGAVAAGIVVGDLIFVCFAVLGMAALADALGGFFLFLRYLAGAYLIWFGITLLRARPSVQTRDQAQSGSTLATSFVSGLVLTLGDVKAILFYASLFPAFVDLPNIQPMDVAVIVAVTIVAVGGIKLGYAYFAARIVSMSRGLRGERAAKAAAGGFMMGAGAYLIAKS